MESKDPHYGHSWHPAWLVCLFTIPAFSVYGRPLQRWIGAHLNGSQLGWLVALTSAAVCALALARVAQRLGPRAWWNLSWSLPLFILLPLQLPIVVERVHFIFFGVFGFLSVARFGLVRGALVCALVGILDEGLQWYLPDRVGDLRDVGWNLIAGGGGAALAVGLHSRRT